MNDQSKKLQHDGPVNPIFARMFGTDDVMVINSLFEAGMRPAKDPIERTTAPEPSADSLRN